MPNNWRDAERERTNALNEARGKQADAAAASQIGKADLAAASGQQRDEFAPTLSDFPNPGGLNGAAMQNQAYKEALAKYQSDPEFKAQFMEAKKKAMEGAMAEQAAASNRRGMR